jgi:Kef-type K+ transport system membrane component KefB
VKIEDLGFAAMFTLSGYIMSYLGLPVPNGLGIIHIVNAAAVGAGYLIGIEFKRMKLSPIRRITVFAVSAVLSVFCVVTYLIAISWGEPGLANLVYLLLSAFFCFFSFSVILGNLFGKQPS